MTGPDVPQEWIDAAMAVLGDGEWDRTCEGDHLERAGERQGLLAIALEAAAPLLAAAERLRLAGLADNEFAWIEPDPEAPGRNRGVYDFTAAIAAAVVRERERCAQLAEQHGAHYGCYVSIEGSQGAVVTSGLRPFAAKLREPTP